MSRLVIIPGRSPHWVSDHARHVAQRLTESGRVMVVFTHVSPPSSMLPGQLGNASVLGHSVSGYPIWTGRLRAALGVRRSGDVSVIVLWNEASHLLALWTAVIARLRSERVVLDIPEAAVAGLSIADRAARRLMRHLAAGVVQGEAVTPEPGRSRVVLALCGSDRTLARLLVHTFEGMSDAAAGRWRLIIHVDARVQKFSYQGNRRVGKVTVIHDEPSVEVLRSSDVLLADFGCEYEDFVHQAVLSGGAGIVVGQPVAGRIARCHDGVWLAQRNAASILVALEASSGDLSDRPGSVTEMREQANEVIAIVERAVAA